MKIFRQLCIIFGILLLGHVFQQITGFPIPGTVLGLIILLICLLTGIVKIDMIEDISKFFLDNLAFFFVPGGVGLISSLGLIKNDWLPILMVIIISTMMVIVVTGLTVQGLNNRKKRSDLNE